LSEVHHPVRRFSKFLIGCLERSHCSLVSRFKWDLVPVVYNPPTKEISPHLQPARLDLDILVVNSASLGVMGSTGGALEPFLRIQAAVAVHDFMYHVLVGLASSLLHS
jgi:hypothetical protein